MGEKSESEARVYKVGEKSESEARVYKVQGAKSMGERGMSEAKSVGEKGCLEILQSNPIRGRSHT